MLEERLKRLEGELEEIERKLADPEVASDPGRLHELSRRRAEIEPVVERYRALKRARRELEEVRELLDSDDPELKALAKEEERRLEGEIGRLEKEIKRLLLPKDPLDERKAIVEIRAGTGGEEAALFAADLFRMYSRFAERMGWRIEVISQHPTPLGGFKEISFVVDAKGAYGWLKHEAGVHRVQRVPVTESAGRIHTSAATVAVLPEPDPVEVEIKPEEIRVDTMKSSGPGGQHMQKTESAVRITHLPTGITAYCQEHRSQQRNREVAMRLLRARLLEFKRREQEERLGRARRQQVGTGDRSEKIRTYNFPQHRVTDHRINLTLYELEEVLDGELERILEPLREAEEEARLKEWEERAWGESRR